MGNLLEKPDISKQILDFNQKESKALFVGDCALCLSNPIETVYTGCGHQLLCRSCGIDAVTNAYHLPHCILCRYPSNILQTYPRRCDQHYHNEDLILPQSQLSKKSDDNTQPRISIFGYNIYYGRKNRFMLFFLFYTTGISSCLSIWYPYRLSFGIFTLPIGILMLCLPLIIRNSVKDFLHIDNNDMLKFENKIGSNVCSMILPLACSMVAHKILFNIVLPSLE